MSDGGEYVIPCPKCGDAMAGDGLMMVNNGGDTEPAVTFFHCNEWWDVPIRLLKKHRPAGVGRRP